MTAGSADLAVLGAGPAGLAAAWRAARRGYRVVVFERAPAVGGLAAGLSIDGVRADHGSHRLHPSIDPRILADLRDLLGDDLQLRTRHGRLRVAGRWVGFPLRPAELARTLPPAMLGRAAVDALTSPLRRGTTDSYADALRAGLGPTLYDALYAPYARKLWGLPGEEIDAEQARRRVSADTPTKILRRMVRGGRGTGAGRTFFYPRRGFGQIVSALSDAAVDAGAEVRCSTRVDAVTVRDDAVRIRVADGSTFTANRVFSTVPLPTLARMTEPSPSDDALADAARLEYRAMLLVYVTHDGRRPWTPFDAHYLPGPETPITRISEPANYRDSAEDPGDRTVLCAEIPCNRADRLWDAADPDLADVVADTAASVGLPALHIAGVHVRRVRHVYPIYRVGYRRHLDGVDAWAGSLPRVTTFGRQGLFAHDNTHHAMAMAYDAVDALNDRDSGFDTSAWALARQRFAAHIVED